MAMPTIRELTPQDDFDEVGRIYAESWKASYCGIVPQAYLNKLTHDRWSAMLRADPSASLGLFLDGVPVGTSCVCFARDPQRVGWGEIVSIYLLPEYTGRGHGKALMAAALHKLKNEGCTDVCLWALTQNVRAEGFYAHMGFSRTGRTMREAFGGSELELTEFGLRFGREA